MTESMEGYIYIYIKVWREEKIGEIVQLYSNFKTKKKSKVELIYTKWNLKSSISQWYFLAVSKCFKWPVTVPWLIVGPLVVSIHISTMLAERGNAESKRYN